MTKAVIGLPLAQQEIASVIVQCFRRGTEKEIGKTTGIDKSAVDTISEQFMTVVKDSLSHGENVYLRCFGFFIVKTRVEKTARNISKNCSLVIPARNTPAFKPANCFNY